MSSTPLLDDRFLVLETLGRGGMGRVYRAFDRVEERFVALKVPFSNESSGPGHPLSAEYDAWSRLSHPNIVRAYELGRAVRGPIPAGTPYLVLESFAGLPAHRAFRPGSATPQDLERLARRLLHALVHVHERGLVHRDLKPANILVGGARNGRARIKLTDFGLAAESGRAGRPGCLSGSVSYVAPESVVGLPVDGRTDLYGLGILLFYLTTGRMPFGSNDPEEILRWHLEGPPADPRQVCAEHGERFARFVRRLTCRDPDARPASAGEALALLVGDGARSIGGSSPPLRRSELAAVRLALDAARLGARRCHALPAETGLRREVLREARVLSQVHGVIFLHLGAGGRREASNLSRVVLRLLLRHGSGARSVVARFGLHRGLPLAVLGGLPLWDRLRPSGELDLSDRDNLRSLAHGVRRFLVASAARRTTVLAVDRAALRDPLAREVVDGLRREPALGPSPGRGGLLILLDRHEEHLETTVAPAPRHPRGASDRASGGRVGPKAVGRRACRAPEKVAGRPS